MFPPQQGWFWPPHWQVPPLHVRLGPQVVPAQHAWPSSPHWQVPAMHEKLIAHV
jgi:hypothetical protein